VHADQAFGLIEQFGCNAASGRGGISFSDT
jgi:hypothetical protein